MAGERGLRFDSGGVVAYCGAGRSQRWGRRGGGEGCRFPDRFRAIQGSAFLLPRARRILQRVGQQLRQLERRRRQIRVHRKQTVCAILHVFLANAEGRFAAEFRRLFLPDVQQKSLGDRGRRRRAGT